MPPNDGAGVAIPRRGDYACVGGANIRVSADARTAELVVAAIERAGRDGASPLCGRQLRLTTALLDEARSPRSSTSADLELLLDDDACAPVFHSAWTLDRARGAQLWRIASPATIGILEVLAALPEVVRMSAVVIRPVGRGLGALHGPIDSLRFDRSFDCCAPAWLARPDWNVHSLVASHTRCWVVSLALDLRDAISSEAVISRLMETGRIIFAPEAFGFEDTALLAEFFRDLGRPLGEFTEIVALPRQLELAGRRLHLWLAIDEASRIAQALDCAAAYVAGPEVLGAVRGATARSLGLLRSFCPPVEERQ